MCLMQIITNGENFRKLLFSVGAGTVTFKTIRLISKRCKLLENFSIFSDHHVRWMLVRISNEAFVSLLKSCSRLKHLNVDESFSRNLVSFEKFLPFKSVVKLNSNPLYPFYAI